MTDVTARWPLGAAATIAEFVGRRHELGDVRRQMEASRLVTLTGPGGIGKTRLAMEAAARVRRAFADGVWPVELASVEDGREVAPTVMLALASADQSNRTALERLISHVKDRRLLIILDNCEHLLGDTTELVTALLDEAPGLHVLATSRESLGIVGEHVYVVPPLAVPSAEHVHNPANIDLSDAVRLLVDRARHVVPDFGVHNGNRDAVRQLCEWLDGMPLAIELAATRLRTLSVGQMVERLDHRFQLLNGGNRTARPRQQTLRALIDWSYELCTADEQHLWARLAVFPGTFDLNAVEDVCSSPDLAKNDIVDLLDRLVAKSVVRVDRAGERVRYGQLMTVREYGTERLAESGEYWTLKRRHRDHYLSAAARMVDDWCGPGQDVALADMHLDHPNLLSALEWSVNTPGEQATGAVLASCLRYHWIAGGFLSDGRPWLERILESLPTEATPHRGAALWTCAWVALIQGDRQSAAARLREAEDVAATLDDARLGAHVAHWWGLYHLFCGELDTSVQRYRDAIAVHSQVGDTASVLTAQFQMAMAEVNRWRLREALEICDEAVQTSQEHGERWNQAYAQWVTALAWWRLGEFAESKSAALTALDIQQDFTDGICTALALELLSQVEAAGGHYERACSLFGAAQSVWTNLGTTVEAFGPQLTEESHEIDSTLREQLGSSRVDNVINSLAQTTKFEAITIGIDSDSQGAQPAVRDNPLTKREYDVARLVAQGLSNREIATSLVISPRTVDGHLERILGKLDFGSRTEVAAWISAGDRTR